MIRVAVAFGLFAIEEYVSIDSTIHDLRNMFPNATRVEILDVIMPPQEIIVCHIV